MFKIILDKDNKLHVKGTFNFGYIGTYCDDQIEVDGTLEEVREWDIVNDNMPEDASDNEITAYLNDYFTAFEQKISQNIKLVNNNFLMNVFADMESCGNEFWNIPELTIQSAMPEDPDTGIYEPNFDVMGQLESEYSDSPNDGTVLKSDVEAAIRKHFPMFNLDKLLSSVVPEYVGLTDGYISFQCSDSFHNAILCGAYDSLDEQLVFTDWHNF